MASTSVFDTSLSGLLTGRVALVTGAAGALGESICRTFARAGAEVVGVDLVDGGACDFVADVATAEGNRLMVAEAVRRHGHLDVLVLNAGVQFVAPIPEFPEDEWDRLMNVMVKGPFLALKAAWAELTGRPASRVLITSSVSGLVAEPFKAAYVSAKHAVNGLAKVAALEGAPHGLTANAVAPGWMSTPMVERQLPEQMALRDLTREQVLELLLDRQPVKRLIGTDEVAALFAFLASDLSSSVTGVCLPADLGTLAS
ncbi:SDR family oxidoreductase [Actinoallomurus iriomotensis]|uniref:SDR family oxidoreductase n=1 Tax=Actinoallomurus iriomotensis TaxID=478107 RepID=UPI0025546A49|nr:SDR family oxidoreductase [Actinoallomurus iriomotensis]